jgi:chondroitin AC lyase
MYKPIVKLKLATFSMFFVTMVSFMLFFSVNIQAQTYDFPALIDKVATERYAARNDGETSFGDVSKMNGQVENQNDDGSWSDINYSDTNWHLWRLWHLAGAVSNSSHSKYNATAYKKTIKKGLQFWYEYNYVDSNWWFNKIAFPQILGEILIFMREFSGFITINSSTEIDETQILSLFKPTLIQDISSHGSGGNATDIALHYLYRVACSRAMVVC